MRAFVFSCLAGFCCVTTEFVRAENPKYLPRLGPSPILFYTVEEAPAPFLLPPLDLGVWEEDKKDENSEDSKESGDKTKKKSEPNLRTRKTSISSRPDEIMGPLPVPGGVGSPGAGSGAMPPHEAAVETLLPDGFDID